MANTLIRAYPYPAPTADPDVPYWIQQLAEKLDVDVDALDKRPVGHMGKTNGFQSVTTAAVVTMDAAQILRGGMTFDNANDALVIPKTGVYRVNAKLYISGAGTGRQTASINKIPAGGGAAVTTGLAMTLNKVDTNDWHMYATELLLLNAGEKLQMNAGGTASAYGGDGYNGCFIEAELLQV